MEPQYNLTVLVVEDDPLFRDVLANVIVSRFPRVLLLEAGSLGEARKQLRTNQPSVLLIDICLPDGKGFALVEELRRAGSRATIAICTSHDLPEYRDAAGRCGANDYLAKGALTPEELVAVIERGKAASEADANRKTNKRMPV